MQLPVSVRTTGFSGNKNKVPNVESGEGFDELQSTLEWSGVDAPHACSHGSHGALLEIYETEVYFYQ